MLELEKSNKTVESSIYKKVKRLRKFQIAGLSKLLI